VLNIKPCICNSYWDSGGYKPYLSTEGKKENEKIVGMVMDQDGITFTIETEK